MSEFLVGTSRLRVAFLNWRDSGHPEAGGAEVFLEQVSADLARRGHEVTALVSRYPGAAARERVGNVRHVRMGGRLTVYPRVFTWLLRHRSQFDIVIDVQNGLPFWSPLLRLPGINVTHHIHREQWSEVFGPVRARLGWWLESRVAPRLYRHRPYFTVSAATRRELSSLGIAADRITVGYSGLDDGGVPFAVDEALRATTPTLVVVGRLVPHKRVELAIDAVAALRDRFPELTLWVVGEGYWRPELEEHARRAGVTDRVRFTGLVDEPTKRRLLAHAWLNVLPSVKEGWGLVVVEAGIHSTPTVAFRSAGGTNESVVDGRTGLLVDDAVEFTEAIGDLMTQPAKLRRMGQAARAHASEFTWSGTAAAVESALFAALRPSAPDDALTAVPACDRPADESDRPSVVVPFEQRAAEQGNVQRRLRQVRPQPHEHALDQAAVGDD